MEPEEQPVPVFGTWRGWYLLVVGMLLLDVLLLLGLEALFG